MTARSDRSENTEVAHVTQTRQSWVSRCNHYNWSGSVTSKLKATMCTWVRALEKCSSLLKPWCRDWRIFRSYFRPRLVQSSFCQTLASLSATYTSDLLAFCDRQTCKQSENFSQWREVMFWGYQCVHWSTRQNDDVLERIIRHDEAKMKGKRSKWQWRLLCLKMMSCEHTSLSKRAFFILFFQSSPESCFTSDGVPQRLSVCQPWLRSLLLTAAQTKSGIEEPCIAQRLFFIAVTLNRSTFCL